MCTRLAYNISYIAEVEGNIGTNLKRQVLRTHRPFKAHILDKEGKEVLMVKLPGRDLLIRDFSTASPCQWKNLSLQHT